MELRREADEGDAIAPRALDRLLLDEANHRVANEVAAALAALHLVSSAKGHRARSLLIEMAIDRLESFGECSRILAGVASSQTDVGALVAALCRAMMRSRAGSRPSRVRLDVGVLMVDGEIARRIGMIAYELVTNALKHAFRSPGGELEVRLEFLVDAIFLSIIDDGPGLGPGRSSLTGGKRLGGRIVGDLVRASRGSLECETGPEGTAIHVMIPAGRAA